jgi:hypothetical protein
MTPEERDYREALRRIKEAEDNKSVELDLGRLEYLSSFPPELASLTSLQELALSSCTRLSDLSPLAELTSPIPQTSPSAISSTVPVPAGGPHLTPITLPRRHAVQRRLRWPALPQLQSLNLYWSRQLSGDLEPLLPQLQELYLCRFNDLPSEICGQDRRKTSFAKSALTSPI